MKRIVIALAVTAVSITACSSGTTDSANSAAATSAAATTAASATPAAPATERPTVVAAFYPLEYAARTVGGDMITVTGLTPAGGEPHDLELSAAQVVEIAQADLVLYVKGYQPAVDEAVAQQAADHSLDVSAGLTLLPAGDEAEGSSTDPHVWLNPMNMASIGAAVAERLTGIDSAQAPLFATNSEALTAQMSVLNDDFVAGLANCRSQTMVVSHEAFAYLGAAFGMTQVGISGLAPDAEPSPARIKDVAAIVTSEGITTIYYETLVDPKVAQTLADETGVATAVLDPIEGLVQGSTESYPSIMAKNLVTLQAGQGCA
jgi:zinc transport system substrate-binding protein